MKHLELAFVAAGGGVKEAKDTKCAPEQPPDPSIIESNPLPSVIRSSQDAV